MELDGFVGENKKEERKINKIRELWSNKYALVVFAIISIIFLIGTLVIFDFLFLYNPNDDSNSSNEDIDSNIIMIRNPLYVDYKNNKTAKKIYDDFYDNYDGSSLSFEDSLDYVEKIGVNGLLDAIEKKVDELNLVCHSQGHPIGLSSTLITTDINNLVEVCQKRCNNACFHGSLEGVLLNQMGIEIDSKTGELIDPPDPEDFDWKNFADSSIVTCNEQSVNIYYSLGECSHAVGHTIYMLSDMDIDICQTACNNFDHSLGHYCAGGIFMQYFEGMANEHETDYGHPEDFDWKNFADSSIVTCNEQSVNIYYSLGECSHAVGHTIYMLSDMDIDICQTACNNFDHSLGHYCAGGIFMQYFEGMANEHETDYGNSDDSDDPDVDHTYADLNSITDNELIQYSSPCGNALFPAACWGYLWRQLNFDETYDLSNNNNRILFCYKQSVKFFSDENTQHKSYLNCIYGIAEQQSYDNYLENGSDMIPIIERCNNLCENFFTVDDLTYACLDGCLTRQDKYWPELFELSCEPYLDSLERYYLCLFITSNSMYSTKKLFDNYVMD
eukprot:TRINITY_DN1525_c1_g2_i1.p1 TRINITY_DN1525_c1_g2~~TRINITY_DN1525_c1_g2_i1.p1  ORF type:complete len:558 (+),score=173.89 TRINITY_DN1525_c1_g2_i1:189-1862(+)